MDKKLRFLVKKIHPNSIIPKRKTKDAAGYDLSSIEDKIIYYNETVTISTGISVHIPHGYYGRIADRSSFALRGIHVKGGVIDSDYRGVIQIIFHNTQKDRIVFDKSNNRITKGFEINVGDRVAQLIIEKIATIDAEEVEMLDDTERDDKGFGSTGKS